MQQQKLCLKWNNHTLNLLSVLETFQQKDILVDVTLSCEGHNIKAHKMVLSACSPYFQNIFLENPCQHPIVIINGMKYEDITAILNFMYKGEVNVSHDSLSSFLQAAEALKVKGLAEVCGEKKSPGSGIQEPEQNEQTRPQRTETPTTKRRQRNRKRSLSDSNRSDDEAAPRKHKGLNSPEVHELSGDESYTGDMSSNGQNSRVPQNVYSRSHQSSSNITADEMDDEYEVEPSKMLEQTLTTDNANSASSDNSLRIERIMGNATEMESSSLHEPESPPDIKPIIEYGESSAGPSEGSMMVYNEQSQPGPSSMQDGSLLHDNSHTQDFRMDIMKSLENFQKESLRQLNEILSRVNVIEKRIDDTGQEEEDPAATELEHVLPMKNIDQLRGLETKLKDKTYFIQVVNILKRIGGSDVYSVVVGILKRLLTNELAEQYSWAGAKKKLPFKDLTLFKLILETVRTHYPSTETEVGQLVAKWLVQARLRRERAEQKLRKSIAVQEVSEESLEEDSRTNNVTEIIVPTIPENS